MKSFRVILLFAIVLFCNLFSYQNLATGCQKEVGAMASYCLSGGNDCIILLVCNYSVRLIHKNRQFLPKAICAEGAVTLDLTSPLNPQLTFSETNVTLLNKNKKCDCLACKESCSASTSGEDSSKQGNAPSQISLSDLNINKLVLQANSCVTESPKSNCLFLKACNLRVSGIQQNDIPTICSDGTAKILSTLKLSNPTSSLLQLQLENVRLYTPNTTTGICACSANSCNFSCVSNPLNS